MEPPTAVPRFRDIALPAYGPTVLNGIGHGSLAPIVALQARALGASVGEAAVIVGLLGLGQLLMALPAGALVARIGERWSLTLVGLLETVLMLAAWRTDSVPAFSALTLALGATWTVFLQARQGFLIDIYPVSHRARAMATLGGTHRIGLLVGPLLGFVLIGRFGLESMFLLGAVMALSSVALVQLMPDLGASTRRTTPHRSVWEVLRAHRRDLVLVGSAATMIGASRSLRTVLLPLWCDHVGISPEHTALIFAIASAVDVSLFYPAGWLMDHHGRAIVAFPVVATAAVGSLLLPLTDGFYGVLAVAVLIGIGNGLGSGIVMTMGADTAPVDGRAQYLGGWRLMGDAGIVGAPLALSVLTAFLPLAGASLAIGAIGLAGTAWSTYWARDLDRRLGPPPGRRA